jgi:hypothetical protein
MSEAIIVISSPKREDAIRCQVRQRYKTGKVRKSVDRPLELLDRTEEVLQDLYRSTHMAVGHLSDLASYIQVRPTPRPPDAARRLFRQGRGARAGCGAFGEDYAPTVCRMLDLRPAWVSNPTPPM